MDDHARRQREAAIFAAAYDQLAEHGYGGASMLRIAKAAKASNETLYRWYGDKDGLFGEMVRANAAEAKHLLGAAVAGEGDPWAVLARLAPILLGTILGDRAVLLNRAAASDPSGALGATISAGGRDEIKPLLDRIMHRICVGTDRDPREATDWFVSLLIGDLQIRRVINERGSLSEEEIAGRAAKALSAFQRLIGSPQDGF